MSTSPEPKRMPRLNPIVAERAARAMEKKQRNFTRCAVESWHPRAERETGTIDERYWEEYLDLVEEEATLRMIEPPYLNPRRGPGFGKSQLLLPLPEEEPEGEDEGGKD